MILNLRDGFSDMRDLLGYEEALTGLLDHGDGELRDYQETSQLTSLIYCQEIVHHPPLIEFPDYSSEKLDALVDMVTEGGDFHGEKVIVFTSLRARSHTGDPRRRGQPFG